MAGPFTFKMVGLHQTARRMRDRHGRLLNMTQAHARASDQILGWVMRNFRAEGKMHDDARLWWPPLAPSTVRSRIRKNLKTAKRGRNIRSRRSAIPIYAGRAPMLVDTGTLRGGFINRWTSRSAIVENYVPYAEHHEEGVRRFRFGGGSGGFAVRGRGSVPQRKMLPDKRQALKIVLPIYGEGVKLAIR